MRLVNRLDIENFLIEAEGHPVIDVRAPAEFLHAHIPGALSIPLFSDEERAIIGTLYKQKGRETAMMKGLEFYGPNMQRILHELKLKTEDRQLFVHCWRGGMRSGVVSWMLDLFGYKVTILNKGYKAFRKTVLSSFHQSKNIIILGGKTGSAKTAVLQALKTNGEQIVDLEALAHHKGSAFGGIGQSTATSQEHFENELYMAFRKLDPERCIWLEDESQRIGQMNIPNELWAQMRKAKVIYLDVSFEKRLDYLADTYGSLNVDDLKAATIRIQKKLGGLETRNTLQFLAEGKIKDAFAILLKYYDKFYERATSTRLPDTIEKILFDEINPSAIASLLTIKQAQSS